MLQSAYGHREGRLLHEQVQLTASGIRWEAARAPFTLSETIEWAWSVPPSAVRAQGFTRIDDFARHVKQVRAKRAELRKQRPDPLRRGILDMLEPILLDCPYIQKAAVREAGVNCNPQFHVWWGGGKPHVYNDVR